MEDEEIDFNVDFDFDEQELGTDFCFDEIESKYITPPVGPIIRSNMIKYEYAKDMAKNIEISKGSRFFAIISGKFIFGDFIEALIVEKGYKCKSLTISTLSMSQENIDSLANLLHGEDIDELNLIISCFFHSHERSRLIKYAYKELDFNNKFQLAVANTHCKTALIETYCGKYIVIHGSANLRSSGCIEQFEIEESKELFDFHSNYHHNIIDFYKTIEKPLRSGVCWQQTVQQEKQEKKVRPN